RLHDLGEAAAALREIHAAATGRPHARPEPSAARLAPDALSNRAVSMLDLGRFDEAEDLLDEALAADPEHPYALYHRELRRWRHAECTDEEVVRRLEAVRASCGRPAEHALLTGCVHLERGDGERAHEAFAEAA